MVQFVNTVSDRNKMISYERAYKKSCQMIQQMLSNKQLIPSSSKDIVRMRSFLRVNVSHSRISLVTVMY